MIFNKHEPPHHNTLKLTEKWYIVKLTKRHQRKYS